VNDIEVAGTKISVLVDEAADPIAVLTLAHGAGADMHHAFMADVAAAIAAQGITCVRHQFPYTEAKRRRIDPKPMLLATIRRVALAARETWPSLPLFVGGKSMGGRMATLAAADAPLQDVRGIVLFGFPLHPRGEPSTERATHLPQITVPMLFLHGTRDELGSIELLRTVIPPAGRLHIVEHADHGFGVLRRSGRTGADVLAELAARTRAFVADVTRATPPC
jgi:predicted alpha/beta-hydrolase family hydrolase